MFTQIDQWIGKTLFVPPIIRLCQATGQTQFAVARLFWFVAALDGFYHAETLLGSLIWGAMSVVMMVTAARRADRPTASFMVLRLLALAFLMLDLVKGAVTGVWAGVEFWILVLIAEYASIIRTIPPRDVTKPAAKATATAK